MYNHNKAQQSKNLVHISWDILYAELRSELPQVAVFAAELHMFSGLLLG